MQNDSDAGRRLAIVVNGEQRQIGAATLFDALEALGYTGQKVATAVNGEFVPARRRAEVRLVAGDEIEIVAPRQGG